MISGGGGGLFRHPGIGSFRAGVSFTTLKRGLGSRVGKHFILLSVILHMFQGISGTTLEMVKVFGCHLHQDRLNIPQHILGPEFSMDCNIGPCHPLLLLELILLHPRTVLSDVDSSIIFL